MNTETLDHFYLHSPPIDVLSSSEIYDGLASLKGRGVCDKVGVALLDTAQLDSIPEGAGLDVIQVELNLLSRADAFERVRRFAVRRGVMVIARQPFSGGTLVSGDASPSVRRMQDVADRHQVSLRSLALRYLLSLDWIDRVLVGTTSVTHLDDNLMIAREGALDAELLDEVSTLIRERS